jgi:hypothetical protein
MFDCFSISDVKDNQCNDRIGRLAQKKGTDKHCKDEIILINYPFDSKGYELDNLYPLTDQVHMWNIFVVGNDKTYILANVCDPEVSITNSEYLLNRKAENILPVKLQEVFNKIWDRTLSGSQLQFYLSFNGRMYFVNTYPILNNNKKVIGAIMFMRKFESDTFIEN